MSRLSSKHFIQVAFLSSQPDWFRLVTANISRSRHSVGKLCNPCWALTFNRWCCKYAYIDESLSFSYGHVLDLSTQVLCAKSSISASRGSGDDDQ